VTNNAIVQCTLYFVVLIALGFHSGPIWLESTKGEATTAQRLFGPIERLFYRIAGVDSEQGDELEAIRLATCCSTSWASSSSMLCNGFRHICRSIRPSSRLSHRNCHQHRHQLCHQHQLASLRRRDNSQLFYTNGCIDRAELRVRRGGHAVLVALIRGFARRTTDSIGNFWVDMTKTRFTCFLPLSIVLRLVLVSQGVVQTFGPYVTAHLLQFQ